MLLGILYEGNSNKNNISIFVCFQLVDDVNINQLYDD